jgi:GT2 family glycosyltransferase
MRETFAVVILNRNPELARRLILSIRQTHARFPRVVVVRDGHQEGFGPGVETVQGVEPFIFSRNANIGINHVGDLDVILCNDDTECVNQDAFERLANLASRHNVGLLAPLIDGGVGCDYQRFPLGYAEIGAAWDYPFFDFEGTICFPCVFISRKAIREVGLLDEDYVDYGFDDDDYCIRMRDKGFRTCITPRIVHKHGSGGRDLLRGQNWSCSFAKNGPQKTNLEVFLRKHPDMAGKFR